MATLKQLIEDGLQVGALVKSRIIESYYGDEVGSESNAVWQWDGTYLNCILTDNNLFQIGDQIRVGYQPNIFEPTTAHDAGIDRNTLPIEEPFWTGFTMCPDGKIREILESVEGEYFPPEGFDGEGYQEPDYFKFTDGSCCYEYDCQPCLPPKG
jgi:hypothetical protein